MDVDSPTPNDLINLRKTTHELLHMEITKTHSNMKKLQQNLEKDENLLNLERVATSTRAVKIKDLDAMIMRLGFHPQEVEATKLVRA